MRASLPAWSALWLIATLLTVSALGVAAQSPARTHVGHILTAFSGTPDGAALLAVAEADAALAVQHAQLAGRDQTDIGPMHQHARHVMQILDPAALATGPGSGFGVGPAARAIAQHAELAAQGGTDGVRTHSGHVATAARAVDARAMEMIELARRLTRTTDYMAAYDMVRQLQAFAGQLVPGSDTTGDGQIALDEGGLQHVRQHAELLSTAAGQ
jgi:hypothetical protein